MKYSLKKQNEIGGDRTLDAVRKNGMVAANNERYTLYDLHINELTLSLTELKSLQETRGNSHSDSSEIYFFVEGKGRMQIGARGYEVKKGSVILVPRGEFHRVINLTERKLVFAAVFEGDRSSKKYNFKS